MSYQLKTTGIAANCTCCIAVDPDTDTIKNFANAATTVTPGAGITIGAQNWNGNSRKFIQLTTADYVALGGTLPVYAFGASNLQATVVAIGSAAGSTIRAFGDSTATILFSEIDVSLGGNTHPYLKSSVAINGGQPPPAAGAPTIFGWSLTRAGEARWFTAAHDAEAMTTGVANAGWAPSSVSKTLANIGRYDYSATQTADKIHAVLIFNTALTEAEWDSLRVDWFGTLLESTGGTNASAPGGTGTSTGSGSGGAATGGTASAGTITMQAVDFTSGVDRANETGIEAIVNTLTGAFVVRKTGLYSDASKNIIVTDAALTAGTDYRCTTIHTDGSWGSGIYQAA